MQRSSFIQAFGLWTLCLLVPAVANAQQMETFRRGSRGSKTEVTQTEDGKPLIRYGSKRSSGRWIATSSGRVAIDDGIAWKKHTYYIALTYTLVAVPDGSERAQWARSVSSFWDQLSIGRFQRPGGQPVDALVLGSRRHPDLVEYRSLVTGERIGGSESPAPGKPLDLAASWKGNKNLADEARYELIESLEQWQVMHDAVFPDLPGAPPRDLEHDFSRFVVVLISRGKTVNCSGYTAKAYENEEGVTLRVHAITYQSIGDTPAVWPYGVFVVPARAGKELVVERNIQNRIGGPAIWREWKKWPMK